MNQKLFAFIMGMAVCALMMSQCEDKTQHEKYDNPKIVRTQIENSENATKNIRENFQKAKQAFNKLADSLKIENKHLNEKLQVTRGLLKQQQILVRKHLPCDTLRKETLVLNELINEQDSLCELNMISLHQSVAVRDSQLIACETAFQSMYDVQKENLQRQWQLAENLKRALKSERKKRFENKALTCGLMMMTGVAAILFIHSQH